ncbi:MAG: Flp pilus assembly complex ATPase component TadA [Gammaproteobacteria bacterium]|nr:Flp pilus assembly complex ATPase component TadA [Gammaproteobacteria bacterium]
MRNGGVAVLRATTASADLVIFGDRRNLDPQSVLVVVRDIESAELAIEAAVTGHKVLTTIHTPRASQIIERFEQLGIERWKIAQTLKAACAQRLIKVLCPYCKEQQERHKRKRPPGLLSR